MCKCVKRETYCVRLVPNRRADGLVSLKEVAQAEAGPICASDGGAGQDEEDDKDDHPAAAASAGATPSEAKALLQPIKGSGQQKELEKSFQTALTVFHEPPFQIPSLYSNIQPTCLLQL
jgi:hypothetical protein